MKRTTFINKTAAAGNVASSTPEDRRQINQRNREYRGPYRPAQSRQEFASAATIRIDNHTTSDNLAIRADKSTSKAELSEKQREESTLEDTQAHRNQWLMPRLLLGKSFNPFDPFDSVGVPLNSSVVCILRYYKEVHYRALWLSIDAALENRFEGLVIKRCSPEDVILECMEDASRMNCLLADVGCFMQKNDDIDPGVSTIQLVRRGTACLRQELTSRGADVTRDILIDAIHLFYAASTLDERQAAAAHSSGIKAILSRMSEQGILVTPPNAGMLSLVDLEVSCQILSST